MSVLRDIFRRRLRSLLTITGIAVGVFALAVLGAMAEKANLTLEGSRRYYDGKVTIVEGKAAGSVGYANMPRPLETTVLERVRELPGVTDVVPQVPLVLDEKAIPLGVPALVVGGFLGPAGSDAEWRISEGRAFEEGETGVAMVGQDLVAQLGAKIGETVEVRGSKFEVVGILEDSYTTLDQSVMVPLGDARALYVDSLPEAFREGVDADEIALQATAYVEAGADADSVARLINREIDGVKATGPTELKRSLGETVLIFDAILAGVGGLALLVGGLSVVNTMTISVSERTRETGVKRALGASTWRIARDVVGESATMGALGGVVGAVVGALAVQYINSATAAQTGLSMFVVTGRLVAGAIAFAVFLGTAAGLYPAWHAARMDPVDALAYE